LGVRDNIRQVRHELTLKAQMAYQLVAGGGQLVNIAVSVEVEFWVLCASPFGVYLLV
jgi:hypothetical protein